MHRYSYRLTHQVHAISTHIVPSRPSSSLSVLLDLNAVFFSFDSIVSLVKCYLLQIALAVRACSPAFGRGTALSRRHDPSGPWHRDDFVLDTQE